MFIPDLEYRLTILDEHDKAEAHLGDRTQTKDRAKNASTFAAPHALCLDSRGDLYVIEWLEHAKVRKFKHIPSRVI